MYEPPAVGVCQPGALVAEGGHLSLLGGRRGLLSCPGYFPPVEVFSR